MVLFLDTETYNERPLSDGVYAYSESVEVLIIAYAIDDGPVTVLDMTHWLTNIGPFSSAFYAAGTIVAHNAQFDRLQLERLGYEREIEAWHCTMAQAQAHSLPGGLAALCQIMHVPETKSKHADGRNLMLKFCKPLPATFELRRATRDTHPQDWADFVAYAGNDVEACRVLYKTLPRHNYGDSERAVWHLDQRINDRGVQVDVGLGNAAIAASGVEKGRLALRTQALTNEEVQAATQRDVLLKYLLQAHGISLPDMQAGTLERRLDDPEVPEPVKELLRIRLMASKTSTAKYSALLKSKCQDDRLRGLLNYCGASRTGRWAGRIFQPQNLPRTPKYLADQMHLAIEAIKGGAVDLVYDNVLEVLGAALRGLIVAAPGAKLIVADHSQIEGRYAAWMAGEWWKLEAYRELDAGTGPDLYALSYAASFGISVEEVVEDHEAGGLMRLIGKVQELALGYQGAVGAFGTMAQAYGVDLPEERVVQVVKGWRRANPATTSFWYALQDAAVRAVSTPGVAIACGRLRLQRDGAWLRIHLPSGRALHYPHPRYAPEKSPCRACLGTKIEPGTVDDECAVCMGAGFRISDSLSYMGTDPYSRKWKRLLTYGGKLFENVVQAGARDLLCEGMLTADALGYPICMTVHDEIIAEAPDKPRYSLSELISAMTAVPEWARGLPLAATGYEAYRYRKG